MTTPLPAPAEDEALDLVFQSVVVGITGLPGDMVRPRWQTTVPKQPEPGVDWCGVGVLTSTPDDSPSITHQGTVDGQDVSVRHEELEVLATFYGPNAKAFGGLLRDGLGIPQNVEVLEAQGISYAACGPMRSLGELVNQQWIRRCDVPLTFRRAVTRIYAVENLIGADVHLFDDTTHVDRTFETDAPP